MRRFTDAVNSVVRTPISGRAVREIVNRTHPLAENGLLEEISAETHIGTQAVANIFEYLYQL
jgi:hypothetical protein